MRLRHGAILTVSLILILAGSSSTTAGKHSAAEEQRIRQSRDAARQAEEARASSVALVLIEEERARLQRQAARQQATAAASGTGRGTTQAPGRVVTSNTVSGEPAADAGLDALFASGETLAAGDGSYPMAIVTPPASTSPASSQATSGPPGAAGAMTPVETVTVPGETTGVPGDASSAPPAAPTLFQTPAEISDPMPPTTGASSGPVAAGSRGVELFHAGYSHYSQGDFDQASSAFARFIAENPRHNLADNAQYWIGECALAQGRYEDALAEYRKVLDSFPFGDKVPDALLKTGYSLLSLGRNQEARRYLEQVAEEFPESGAARRAVERLASLNAG